MRLKSIETWPEENWFWKEAGCRTNSSTLDGRTKDSVKLVTKRKAQKNTGSTTAQNSTRLSRKSQRLSESGSKKRELQRRSGSGKEVSSRILSVKTNGTRSFQYAKVGVGEAQELGHTSGRLQGPRCNGRLSRAWLLLESGEHVAGQWCNLIMMKNWDPCTGCTARWKHNSRSSAPSRGRS